MSILTRRLERLYPWFLLSPVLLPIVVWNGLIYPYLVPKTLLFYAITLISVAIFLILVAYDKPLYFSRLSRRMTWIPGALLIVAYLASIFGVDFYRSFWSLFIRGDGLFMYTCAVAFFYLILLSADARFFKRFLRGVAIVGAFVAVYGIGEWLIGGGRIGSLLGNAAFFAGYLGIALLATLMAGETLQGPWRLAAKWAAALEVVAIILTATRGTVLALMVAAVLYLGFLAFSGAGKAKKVAAWTLAVLGILAGLFVLFRDELSQAPFEPIARLASVGIHDPDISSRLFIWRNMAGEIPKAPLLGVGAEHIDVLFNRFYDPTKIAEEWFDRSHNAFLDYFAEFGVAGFALYVLLVGSFFALARRLEERGEPRLAGLAALLGVVYAVQNFFVFDTISSFWLLIALFAVLISASGEEVSETLAVPTWMRSVSFAAVAVLVLLIVPFSVRPAIAAYDLAHAYAYAIVDTQKSIEYLNRGYALATYGDVEYGYEAYDMYANYQREHLTGDALSSAHKAASQILAQNFERYPYDARTALYLAQMLSVAPPGSPVDPNLFSAAIARTIQESPKRAQPWYILANLSIGKANESAPGSTERAQGYAAAVDILRRYIALVPTLSEPHFVLAQLLYATGKKEEASAEALKGKTYYTGGLETAKRAASYYETVFDLPDAAFFLRDILKMDPGNTAAEQDLEKINAYGPTK